MENKQIDSVAGHQHHSNLLSSAIPKSDLFSLGIKPELVKLNRRMMICNAGQMARYVYFPTTAVISAVNCMEDGKSPEVYKVGWNGVACSSSVMASSKSDLRFTTIKEGYAFRVSASDFRLLLDLDSFIKNYHNYMNEFIGDICTSALCNANHKVEQRICRWLRDLIDKSNSFEFDITQSEISDIIGIRRESVNKCLYDLALDGVISLSRGKMKVLDSSRLRKCPCQSNL